MTRKKSKRQARKTTQGKLETRFDCPICNHENVVQCKIVIPSKRGFAFCSVCESRYGCDITPLDKPVDVYHGWIDQVERDGVISRSNRL